MFTIQQIKDANSKVKTGADFPRYINELIELGITKYDLYVDDGHAVYFGGENFSMAAEPKYPKKEIAKTGNIAALQHSLKIHQQGQTDYLTFCEQSAKAGVKKWTIDTNKMTCTYYDLSGHTMVTELIPTL